MVQRTTRQLWGLTARCERAIRALAPHWRAQASIWGEAAVLFERLLLPATWMCEQHQWMTGVTFPPASLRLLTSSVATAAKATQLTGVDPSVLFLRFADSCLPALRRCPTTTVAAARCRPSVATFLLPRLSPATAALPEGPSKLIAAVRVLDGGIVVAQAEAACPGGGGGHDQQPLSCATSAPFLRMLSSRHIAALAHQLIAQMTGAEGHTPISSHQRGAVHIAVGRLSNYGWMLVLEQWSHVTTEAVRDQQGGVAATSAAAAAAARPPSQGGELRDLLCCTIRDQQGGAAATSAAAAAAAGPPSQGLELRDLLCSTIQSLLASPLLDFLVCMQHVVVAARLATMRWSFPEAPSILPVHLMPASMDPDVFESKVAMQVGGSPMDLES